MRLQGKVSMMKCSNFSGSSSFPNVTEPFAVCNLDNSPTNPLLGEFCSCQAFLYVTVTVLSSGTLQPDTMNFPDIPPFKTASWYVRLSGGLHVTVMLGGSVALSHTMLQQPCRQREGCLHMTRRQQSEALLQLS